MTDSPHDKENSRTDKYALAAHFVAVVGGILAKDFGLTPDKASVSIIHTSGHGQPDLPDIMLAVEPIEQSNSAALKAVHNACVKLGNEILLSPTGHQVLVGTNSSRGTAFELIASEFAQALNHHISRNPAPELEEHLRAIEKISMAVIPASPLSALN